MQIATIFLIFFFGIFLTIKEGAVGILDLSLIFWILSIATIYYQKYSDKTLLKRLNVNDFSSIRLKIYLFLFLFLVGIILILTFSLWFYLYSVLIESNLDILGNEFSPIRWDIFKWKEYFFLSFYEMTSIIIFAYFLNHFLKNKKEFIYGFIVIICFYNIFFGNLWTFWMGWHGIDQNVYFHWQSKGSEKFVFMNAFLTPWVLPSMWLKNIVYSYWDANYTLKLFNTSELAYLNVNYNWFLNHSMYLPFFYAGLELAIVFAHTQFKKWSH